MKRILMIVAAAVLTGLIAMSVVLIVQQAQAPGGGIGITLGENGAEDEFRIEGMLPGDSGSRVYDVECGTGGRLGLTFTAGDEQSLLPFVEVSVSFGEEVLYDGALSDTVGETIWGNASGKTSVTVEYSLPLDVGNEAQGASLALTLLFRAEST